MAYFIFFIAFLIRLIYIIQIKSTIFYNNFMLDEAFYNKWALSIAGGEWLGEGIFDALPLYPYILGLIFNLFGYNLFIARLVEITISSFSCLLLYLLAKEVFNKRAGIMAALIGILYAPFIFYSGIFVPTVFVVFLYLVSLLMFVKAIRTSSRLRFLLFGIVAGLAAMIRAGMLIFIPFALIWVMIISADKKKAFVTVLLALTGILLVIMPVALRNYIVSRDVVFLTSHAGMNLYIGNNDKADGMFKAPGWARSNIGGLQADAKTIAERELGRELKSSEVSKYYMSKAISFVKHNPDKFLRLLWRKLLIFINRREIYDVACYPIYREKIPVLRFPFITFFFVGTLGLAGMFIALRDWKKVMPLYLFTFTYTLSILLYFVNSRYRIPFAIAMVLFSGFFISWFIGKIRDKRFVKAGLALILCAVILPVVNMPTGIGDTTATGYINLGSIYIKTGEYDNAIIALKQAIALGQSDATPYNDIGYAYIMKKDYKKAEAYILGSLSKDSAYPFAYINLGLLREKEGNLKAAEKQYLLAINLNPNIPQAHNNLAGLYEISGKRSLAIKEYQKAIELDPENAKTHYNLGVIYGRAGRLNDAEAEFTESLRLDPQSAATCKALDYFK
jgi:Flp pilus assembly protein TadD